MHSNERIQMNTKSRSEAHNHVLHLNYQWQKVKPKIQHKMFPLQVIMHNSDIFGGCTQEEIIAFIMIRGSLFLFYFFTGGEKLQQVCIRLCAS